MPECITGEFLRAVRSRCEEILGKNDTWGLDVSERDPNVVRFIYPTSTTKSLAYVVPHVVLELGTHAEFVPHDRFTIRSLVAEEFPALFTDVNASVIALLAKRTFWEKATILHAEYYRPSIRLSRSATPATTMTLPCLNKVRHAPELSPTCRYLRKS